jgi:hypothetical protein
LIQKSWIWKLASREMVVSRRQIQSRSLLLHLGAFLMITMTRISAVLTDQL